jgi:hypothetical protein
LLLTQTPTVLGDKGEGECFGGMVRILNTGVPCVVSHKPSAGRNWSELRAALRRLTNNDKNITDLTLSWTLVADQGAQQVCGSEPESEPLSQACCAVGDHFWID